MILSRYDNNLNVSDPGPSTSSARGTMPRNESRQAGKRPLRTLTPQEKIDAINTVHNGESKVTSVAHDIGVPEFTLRGWCKAEDKIMSQVNNIKALTRNKFNKIQTAYSDRGNNNGNESSSRSTPTIEATMLGLPSTSGVTRRAEEFETGPSHKKIKLENSSAGSTTANNISISARTPGLTSTVPQSKTSRNGKSLTSIKDNSLHHSHVLPQNGKRSDI
ncbi:DAN protein, partial [Acromyrmex heyeri]